MRYRLPTLVILSASAPIWAYLITVVSQSPGFGLVGCVATPIVLVGVAAAMYQLTRAFPDGFAIAVFLSPIISLASLLVVAAMTRN